METYDLCKEYQLKVPKGRTAYFGGDRHPGDLIEDLLKPHETKKVIGIKDVSIAIEKGELFGLIGPNGSGKTTLVKVLSCLLAPTSGNAVVMGHDVVREREKALRNINVVPGILVGGIWIDMLLTAKENLLFCADLFGASGSKVDEVLATLGLADCAEHKVITFSSGMLARLTLAQGLIREAPLALMDEPLVGVSFDATRDFHKHLRDLTRRGTTVVYATNNLIEAESMCDRVALFNRGGVIALGTPVELIRGLGRKKAIQMEMVGASVREVESALEGIGTGVVSSCIVDSVTGHIDTRIQVDDPQRALPIIVDAMLRKSVGRILKLDIIRVGLEDVFLDLIGSKREGS